VVEGAARALAPPNSIDIVTSIVTDAVVMALWRGGKPDALLQPLTAAANMPASSSSN
jgi:hypothetical protein